VLDVVDQRGQRLLERRGEPVLDLFRPKPRVLIRDRDDRDIDVGKDVRRGQQPRPNAGNQNHHREHDKRVGPIKREFDNPHGQ
jgi:hypothetical protein